MMRTPRNGITAIEHSLPKLQSLVLLKSGLPRPKDRTNKPMKPVPAWRLRYFESLTPSFCEMNNHCTRSKAQAIVVARNIPVAPERRLSTKIVLVLELYRNRKFEAAVVREL